MPAEPSAPLQRPDGLAELLVATITTERPRQSAADRLGLEPEALEKHMASVEKSIADAREMLAQEPGDWMQQSFISIFELERGDLRAAERAALAALSSAPLEPRLLADYAAILTAAGQFDKAALVLDRAEAIDPRSQTVLYNRCALAEQRGDEPLAAALRERIVTRMTDADAQLHDSLEEDEWKAKGRRLIELGAIERERAERDAQDERLRGSPTGRTSLAMDRFGWRPVTYIVMGIGGVIGLLIDALGLGQAGSAIGGLVVIGAIIFVIRAAVA